MAKQTARPANARVAGAASRAAKSATAPAIDIGITKA